MLHADGCEVLINLERGIFKELSKCASEFSDDKMTSNSLSTSRVLTSPATIARAESGSTIRYSLSFESSLKTK